MFEDFKRIDVVIKKHQLSYMLGIAGCTCFVISFPILMLSIFALTIGKVSVTPPEAINPIIEAGWDCIFDRWFWVAMLTTSILGLIFGSWAHPESQLRRKIGRAAVKDYQQTYGWAWK